MKATVTLTLNIGAELDPRLIFDKFEEFLMDSLHDSGYYAPDETPTPRPVDKAVWVTSIKSVLLDETEECGMCNGYGSEDVEHGVARFRRECHSCNGTGRVIIRTIHTGGNPEKA